MPQFSPFVHLHVHSHYSLGDSINRVSDLYRKAGEYNMNSLALTDHGNLFGAAEFMLDVPTGIKPIIGCEMYVTPHDLAARKVEDGEYKYFHLVLLVKNEVGYQNLVELVSMSYLEGFYYKPRINFKLLEEFSEGLVALSACMAGEIPRLILNGEKDKAVERSHYYRELFGSDSFFLELMDHGMPEQRQINQELLQISAKTGIPLVATNDVHYMEQKDSKAHDIFLCIGDGKKLSEEKRRRYSSDQFYFKSYEEMKRVFEPISLEAVHNTRHVADLCNYYSIDKEYKLPHYDVPGGAPYEIYIKEKCYENLQIKLPDAAVEVKERLDFELSVINSMGFASYFLIVQDFINYAKNNGIAVGPGRGSAAGCLVSYLLGITELDPMRYDLLFERFLNPGRVSMPDIDTDFDDFGRERVIEYVKEKYGEDKVAQIITFGRLKARAVIRDVGRVLDIPLSEVDIIAKMIPGAPGTKLKDALKEVPELKAKIESVPIYTQLWEYAIRLEGLNRHAGLHAAGIIIGKDSLKKTVPLYKDPKTKAVATQFEGKYIEEFGLLKMDFLGLRNLRILSQAVAMIKKYKNVEIDLNKLPLQDKKTFALLKKGGGVGVFQCESPGMRELMKKLQPSKFEDIIALIALYRPGPLNSGMTDDFVKRKKNPKLIEYPHKSLKHTLEDTYGVIVYQEQVMLISQIIGGFELKDADNLRKVMGKKDATKLPAMQEKFVAGALAKGYQQDFAEHLFSQMAKFAEYGFNKSHSAAYAYVAYHTAYLKAHYPVEYMSAVLNAEKNKIDSLTKYIKECAVLKIKIHPPHVNSSMLDFDLEDEEGIRFGLSAIKNVGEANIREIITEREKNGPYNTFAELLTRVDMGKKVLETLAMAGALDGLVPNRKSVIHNMEKILAFINLAKKDRNSGMGGLFDVIEEHKKTVDQIHLEPVPEFAENELLKMEKENLGLYISSHPLAKFEKKIAAYSTHSSQLLKDLKTAVDEGDEAGLAIPDRVTLGGILISLSTKYTKNNDLMALCVLEDLESEIKVVFFPKTYQKFMAEIRIDAPLLVTGRLDMNGKEAQVVVEHVELLANLKEAKPKPNIINIKIDEQELHEEHMQYLRQILSGNKGGDPVVFHLFDLNKNEKVNIKVGKEFYISTNEQLLEKIRKIACVEDVWVNGQL